MLSTWYHHSSPHTIGLYHLGSVQPTASQVAVRRHWPLFMHCDSAAPSPGSWMWLGLVLFLPALHSLRLWPSLSLPLSLTFLLSDSSQLDSAKRYSASTLVLIRHACRSSSPARILCTVSLSTSSSKAAWSDWLHCSTGPSPTYRLVFPSPPLCDFTISGCRGLENNKKIKGQSVALPRLM